MKINRRRVIAGIVLLLLAWAGWWRYGGSDAPAGQRPLATLDETGLAHLKAEFNASSDAARVILLLSPS